MLTALLLGLTGSLGHCAGMCSGISLVLQRSLGNRMDGAGRIQVHAGRILSYCLLGLLAGAIGERLQPVFDGFALAQGAVALYAALLGVYFALVLSGLAPSPELLFPGLAAAWRRMFQAVAGAGRIKAPLLVIGMAWGLLPCGLVLAALFTAAVSAAPIEGALRMALFGLGTLPVLVSVGWLAGRPGLRTWPRFGAAAALAIFSLQLGMRSMAAFGLVSHAFIGKVMLW